MEQPETVSWKDIYDQILMDEGTVKPLCFFWNTDVPAIELLLF